MSKNKRVPHNKKWHREAIINEAKKHPTKSAWMKKSMGSYLAAKRSNVFELASKHMVGLHEKWSRAKVLSDARKYRTRSQWKHRSHGAHDAAKRMGIYAEATRHMPPITAPWDPREIEKIAKTFTSITEWKAKSPKSLNAARRLGIYDALSKDMTRSVRTWTDKELITEGRKYKTKAEWSEKSGSSYQIARRRGLMPLAGKHLRDVGNKYFRKIYVIQHKDSKSCYVGLSFDAHKRFEQHTSKNSKQRIDKLLREYHLAGKLILEVLDGKFPKSEAKRKEAEVILKYKADGWTILNTAKAGALGSSDRIHTLQSCIELAKGCNSRTEYNEKHPSAYNAVCARGWARRVFANLPSKVPGRYTRRAVTEAAKKCKSRAEFMSKYNRHYNAASRMRILDEITRHMGRGLTHAIKDESIFNAAQQCGTVQEFQRRFPAEYGAARRRGSRFFNTVAGHLKKMRVARVTREAAFEAMSSCKSREEFSRKHPAQYRFALSSFPESLDQTLPMKRRTLKWAFESCREDALKWATEKEWRENSSGAYTAARKNKWLNECSAHMKKVKLRNGVLTLDFCKGDALKYETRGQWRKASASAYQKAYENRWLDVCCSHMKTLRKRAG